MDRAKVPRLSRMVRVQLACEYQSPVLGLAVVPVLVPQVLVRGRLGCVGREAPVGCEAFRVCFLVPQILVRGRLDWIGREA